MSRRDNEERRRCAYTFPSRRRCFNTATRGQWCDTHHELMTMHARKTTTDQEAE